MRMNAQKKIYLKSLSDHRFKREIIVEEINSLHFLINEKRVDINFTLEIKIKHILNGQAFTQKVCFIDCMILF